MNEFEPKKGKWPPTLKSIGEAVSHLIVPTFSPLITIFVDIKAGVNNERGKIRSRMLDTKTKGDIAAARLMLPDDEVALHRAGKGYFALIEDRRMKDA